jgi:hypothetical protein
MMSSCDRPWESNCTRIFNTYLLFRLCECAVSLRLNVIFKCWVMKVVTLALLLTYYLCPYFSLHPVSMELIVPNLAKSLSS